MAFLKTIWKNNSKHKKLSEEQTAQLAEEETSEEVQVAQPAVENENENDENNATFKLKYLGSTVVEKKPTEKSTSEAVKNVIKVAKASKKKIRRVTMTISMKGITVKDLQGEEIFRVSIYRISNCSRESARGQIFSFISTDQYDTMECHVFLCSKKRVAETVTLAVAQAFSGAYEAWKTLPFGKNHDEAFPTSEEVDNSKSVISQNEVDSVNNLKNMANNVEVLLIDFNDDPVLNDFTFDFNSPCEATPKNNHWVCFDDDFTNETQFQRNGLNLIMT